ncbi:MAG: hypothetical protein JXR34_13195, partial [Bacteroidales bacterium]|nr:hypothetical protein [Bacteroidales bacterium]
MKQIKTFLLLLIFSTHWFAAISQNSPIQIQTILTPPYPVTFSEVTELPSLATVVIQNTDMSNSYTLRFRVKLDGHNGITVTIPETTTPSNPLTLRPGEVKTLSSTEFANIYSGISIENIRYTGISEKEIIQSQRIPDGIYSLCIQAFDNKSMEPLSGTEPTGCSNKMQIIAAEPPVIQFPLNNVDVEAMNPQNLIIRWTSVIAPGSAILYDLRIAEVPEGVNPYDAILSQNLVFYEETDMMANVLVFGPGHPTLIAGKTYTMQITAKGASAGANIKNDGKSDLVTFRYFENENKGNGELPFACGTSCQPANMPRNTNMIANLNPDDVVQAGHFRVRVISAQKSASGFSGNGVIIPFLFWQLPVSVRFDKAQINTNYQLFGGTIIANQKQSLTSISCFTSTGTFQPTSEEDMNAIYNTVIDQSTTIATAMNSTGATANQGVPLPISYGDGTNSIVITDMKLTAQGAYMNMVSGYIMPGDLYSSYKKLILGIDHVCITPAGPAGGDNNTKMTLLNKVTYSPSTTYDLVFEPGNSNSLTGTYANINCDGVQNYHLAGQVNFAGTELIPLNDQFQPIANKKAAAKFKVDAVDPNDWIAELDFEGQSVTNDAVISKNLRLAQLEEYNFKMSLMYIDHSPNQNPEGIVFPTSYPGISSNQWEGVYAPHFLVETPNFFNKQNGAPTQINAHHFLYDEGGYTVEITGNNVLTENNPGTLDGWDFTIARLELKFVQSEWLRGKMRGNIKTDLSETPIGYEAQMNYANNHTRYNFKAKPTADLEADLWSATIKLDTTTRLNVNIIGRNVSATAVLTGIINFDENIDQIPGINISGISFEGLEIMTRSPYLRNGHFDLVGDDDAVFAGFDCDIENIELEDVASNNPNSGQSAGTPKKALKFDLNLNFGQEGAGFKADTEIKIKAKRNNNTKKWEADGVEIEEIDIVGDVPAVSIEGHLNWYQNDATMGCGFRGTAQATFIDAINLSANVILGSKGDFNYWYVDGRYLSTNTQMLVSQLGFRGFAGGAYYNMKALQNPSPNMFGTSNYTPRYEPEKKGWGFKAAILLTSLSDPSTLNGTAQIEMGFRGAQVNRIEFLTNMALFRDINNDGSFSGSSMVEVAGTMRMTGTARNRVLDASFGYNISIPPGDVQFIWGQRMGNTEADRPVQLHFSRNDWKVWLGYPSSGTGTAQYRTMLGLTMGLKYKIFGKTKSFGVSDNVYFAMGSILPTAPSLPNEVRELNLPRFDMAAGQSAGVMTGNHIRFDMPRITAFEIWGNGISFTAGAGLGFDAAITKTYGVTCNGNADYGMNGWRINGQGYLYGHAGMQGKIVGKRFNIAEVKMASGLTAKLPNPSYFRAAVALSLRLPVYGSYTARTSFTVGEDCDFEVDESFTEDLALQKLINSMQLSQEVDSVYAFDKNIRANVALEIPLVHVETYPMGDGSTLKTKMQYSVVLEKKVNGSWVDVARVYPTFTVSRNPNDAIRIIGPGQTKNLRIYFTNGERYPLLEPGTHYQLKFKATLMYAFDNDAFQPLKDAKGVEAYEVRALRFVTKSADPQVITTVSGAAPALNQRFFYMGDYLANNKCYLDYDNENVFDRYNNFKRVEVVWTDVYSGENYYSGATKVIGQNRLEYALPENRTTRLKPRKGRIYKVTFNVIYETIDGQDAEREIYTYYFRTSHYNTFTDKVNDLQYHSHRT